jgi:hypothetical protein
VEAELESNSNFALKIGDYSFMWYPYSFSSSSRHFRVTKGGTPLSTERYLYDMPSGKIRMKWIRKGSMLAWYLGDQILIRTKDRDKLKRESTICIESKPYSYYYTSSGEYVLRIYELSFHGKVDPTWLRSQKP